MAVVVVPRAAVLENHHRPYGRVALDVRDVVALDALGRALEVERFRERGQHRLRAAAVVVRLDSHLLELLPGGLRQLGDQRPFAAALRHLYRDRASAPLSQPARQQLGLLDRAGKDDRAWDVRGARVVLEQEAAEELAFDRIARAVEGVPVVADHLALADVSDLDEHVTAAARVCDQVLVVPSAREHLLPVCDLFDRLQLIAIASRVLEVEPAGRGVHAVLQLVHQHVRSALHEQRHLVDARLVVLGADAPLARSRTPLDVEVEAHLALLEDLIGAGPEWKQLADGLDRAPQRLRGRVRTEVQGAVFQNPP